MPLPELPTDIITVIAQFLAGCHAFGSLASLHMAKRDVRDATMPVLFETVFMDRLATSDVLEGFKYTR